MKKVYNGRTKWDKPFRCPDTETGRFIDYQNQFRQVEEPVEEPAEEGT